jgi:hypothetical protein
MENQGSYDCAVFGDGLAGMVTALLLTRQGERVVMIPDPQSRSRDLRLQFGLEQDGIFYRFLKRWGALDENHSFSDVKNPQIEIASKNMTVSLRDDLKVKKIGSPRFEVNDSTTQVLWDALLALESDLSWVKNFENELISGLTRNEKGWKRYLFIPRSASKVWSRGLKKTLAHSLKPSQYSKLKQKNKKASNSIRQNELFKSIAFLMGPGRFRITSGRFPLLQTLVEAYALRKSPFSGKSKESFREHLRAVLKQKGVRFIDDEVNVHFKKNEMSAWEGFYGNPNDNSLVHFSFSNFIFAHSLTPKTLSFFEENSRKKIELELVDDPCLYIRWQAYCPSHFLPYDAGAEIVIGIESDWPIRVSIFGQSDSESIPANHSEIVATSWLPMVSSEEGPPDLPGLDLKLKSRIEREILKTFRSLTLKDLNSVQFRFERLRDFKINSGVKSKDKSIWHVNHTSYPSLGEYGPIVAGIELARKFSKKYKRDFKL